MAMARALSRCSQSWSAYELLHNVATASGFFELSAQICNSERTPSAKSLGVKSDADRVKKGHSERFF